MTSLQVVLLIIFAQLTGVIVGLVVGFGAGVWWGARNVDILVEEDK